MGKELSPLELELKNRVGEIIFIDPKTITTKKSLERFIEKLVNLGEFIQSHKTLRETFEKLYQNKKLMELRSNISQKEEYERMKKYFGLSDYYLIIGVWEWKTKKKVTMGQVRFLLSPLGRATTEKINHSSLPELQEDIRQYQESVRAIVKRYRERMANNAYQWYKRLLHYCVQFIPDIIRKFI